MYVVDLMILMYIQICIGIFSPREVTAHERRRYENSQ
jgi:uncharacterized DUF497 family protein